MIKFLRSLSLAFAAGCVGAVGNSAVAWLFGVAAITAAAGVKLAPALTRAWIYQKIVWGGLWGFLFLAPVLAGRPFLRGILFSLGPSAVQLFVVLPYQAEKGMLGLQLGALTPLFVIVFNAIWGLVASYWLLITEERSEAGFVRRWFSGKVYRS